MCRDVYAPYRGGAVVDPEAMANGAEAERCVLRGGSWVRDSKRGRSAARGRNAPGARAAENGFRVVITDDGARGGARRTARRPCDA
jgi:formylglycine-generating enzyme required for sulfatase activity